jgi:hypothetical protein
VLQGLRRLVPAKRPGRRRGEGAPTLGVAAAAPLSPPLVAALVLLPTPTSSTSPLHSSLHPFRAQCVQRCCEKFMKHSARVGLRFGELSAAAESQMQAQLLQMQGGGK